MNSNLMEMDPLSYEQYNTYQPPYLPQSHPITHTQPIITHTQPSITHTQPNITHTQPNITHTQPSIPHTQPGITHTQPNITYTQPSISHTQPPLHPNMLYPYKDYYPLPYQTHPANTPITNEETNQVDRTQLNGQTEATSSQNNDEPNTEEDIKPDIKKIKSILKRARILKGKTSSYWNKKIKDKDFKFYGCSVCNIAFQELTELDSHVTIHSNRITSYDIRVQNLKKRKRLKKEKKKKKKDAKVKKELDIEIKPEDGYIGTETAAEFDNKIEKSDKNETSDGKNEKSDAKNEKSDGNNEKSDVKNEKSDDKKKENGKNEVYKCFACNKQFALSYYLKIHVRSHTDEKPYICNCCGESFITASKLGRHNKRIHLAIRHQCRICFQSFSRFELLTKHFDKKHAEQKLEGEPYDYNAILPYLTELEEQFKLEDEAKKLKTEDIWDCNSGPKVEDAKVEKEEVPPARFEFADNTCKDKIEMDIKCEPEETPAEETPAEETTDDYRDLEDDEGVKEERLPPSDDEDEYFPPSGWARSPPPPSPTPPSSPPHKRKGAGACELCNRSFSSKSYLKVHMRTHTGEKPFSCYVCGRGFITASKMHRHVLTHDDAWLGEDGVKPEGVDIKSEVDEDTPEKKPKNKKLKSKIQKAKTKLLKKTFKKDPETKKGRVRPHCCEYCGKKFLHVETLQVHKKSHDGEELIIRCNFCLEPQLDNVAKTEHEATHTGPKPYYCTLCGRNYKDKGAMVYHRKNHKPSDEKLFICDICSKRFNSQAKLARHIVTHSTEKFTLRYECPVCANMFHTRWHVQMHLKSHQKEGLILEENRNAVLAMVLQNARKIPKTPSANPPPPDPPAVHPPDERSRICNICGQVFQHFYYLEEHLKTHGNKIAVEDLDKEEEKKYTCQVCSKSFKLHYYLKLHSFTHTKEKPYICQQCGKGFITKGKLKRHLETHQGLKKYQCHICCKFFTRPSYLRIHVRTIHGTQDYNFRDYGVGVPLGLGGVPLVADDNM